MRVYNLWEEWDLRVYFNHRVTESGLCLMAKAMGLESTLVGASPLLWRGCWQLWHREGKEESLIQGTGSAHSHSLIPECSNLCFVSYTPTILIAIKWLKRKHVYCIFLRLFLAFWPYSNLRHCIFPLHSSLSFSWFQYFFIFISNNAQLQHVEKSSWY